MKVSSPKYITYGIIYACSLLLIGAGFYYSPAYFAHLLTFSGVLPQKISRIILALDTFLIAAGLALFFFRAKVYAARKEVLLALSSLAVIFAATEVAFRFYIVKIDPPQQTLYLDTGSIRLDRIYSPHHYLNYFLTPQYRSWDGLNRHNSFGFRGEEIIIPKPKDTFRIAALGESSTYGTGVASYKESYPFFLQKILREKYGYLHVEVVNAGVGGYNSWESLISLEFRVLDLEPDLVIISHGANDVHARLVNPRSYRGDNSGRRTQWHDRGEPFFFKSALLRFAVARLTGYALTPAIDLFVTADTSSPFLKDTGPNEILGATPMEILEKNPPVYFERNLRNMIAVARENNSAVLLATWAHSDRFDDYAASPHYEKGFDENNAVVKEVALSYSSRSAPGVFFYDFARDMPQDKKYWADGRHPNAAGNLLQAELFAKFLDGAHVIPKK
jgi:lysophospholipase L1-like esterase